MIKKMLTIIFVLTFVTTQPLTVMGGQAVLLTDAELDQVYAGGLNLNFDAFFGSMDGISGLVKGVVGPNPAEKPVVVVNDQNSVKMPSLPSPAKTVDSPSPVNGPAQPEQSGVPIDPSVNSPVLNPEQDGLDISLNDVGEAVSIVNTPDIDAPEIPKVLTSADIAGPDVPQEPDQPQAVQSAAVPQLSRVIDSVMTSDGKIGVVAFESMGEIMPVEVESLAVNSLNVSETAQQYLSALNNVNAVGSTVLIQQNLVILINSTVENLTNGNALDMGSFFPVQ